MKKTKKSRKLIYILIGISLFIGFCYVQNNSLVTSKYEFTSSKIPEEFDDFRIVHLSDLHNKTFGSNQKRLIAKIKKTEPDLIVYTGDIVDSKKFDIEPSLILMKELTKFVPVYYVTGNHEAWTDFTELETGLKEASVHVMRNQTEKLTIGEEHILITGIDDPAFNSTNNELGTIESNITHSLDNLLDNNNNFQLLLTHRPEALTVYANHQFDLVFAGHAHGGQFRIPFWGGVVAPNQGFLPTYTSGTYTEKETTMIVSRGLGNSIIPLRLFNRPEIVVVDLKTEKEEIEP